MASPAACDLWRVANHQGGLRNDGTLTEADFDPEQAVIPNGTVTFEALLKIAASTALLATISAEDLPVFVCRFP